MQNTDAPGSPKPRAVILIELQNENKKLGNTVYRVSVKQTAVVKGLRNDNGKLLNLCSETDSLSATEVEQNSVKGPLPDISLHYTSLVLFHVVSFDIIVDSKRRTFLDSYYLGQRQRKCQEALV